MAREGKPVAGPWDRENDFAGDIMTDIKLHQEALDELIKKSNALPEGELKGYVFSEPVADGSAYYLVDSVKPLVVRHIPFLDGYRVQPYTIRGLTINDLKRRQKLSLSWARIFDKKTT